jgi:hypothetical protein
MRISLEKATQTSMTRPFLSGHHTSFLWALVQELVARPPNFLWLAGELVAFLGDHARQATLCQKLSGEVRVVGTIEVDARMLGQLEGAIHALQGFTQKRRVMEVCRSAEHPQRVALRAYYRRALDAPFPGPPGFCPRSRRHTEPL